jgi:hypothetical protein
MRTKLLFTSILAATALYGCNSPAPPPPAADQTAPPPAAPAADQTAPAPAPADNTAPQSSEATYTPPEPQPVVSVYQDPPTQQPPPVEVAWAPPPMLVEPPPPEPGPQYAWTGGYWAWYGRWVWIHGRWLPPPQPGYHWVPPYYDHRGDHVVFVGGFWGGPHVSFVAPAMGMAIAMAVVLPGVMAGPPPMGPEGVFVPAPPGPMLGIIIPAPLGTPPAVVTGAPPVVAVGMRVSVSNTNITNTTVNNTVINNTVINNRVVNNVTISAPASATANHQEIHATVPAQAHLAAALPPVVRVPAPTPASSKPIPPYVPGREAAGGSRGRPPRVRPPCCAGARGPRRGGDRSETEGRQRGSGDEHEQAVRSRRQEGGCGAQGRGRSEEQGGRDVRGAKPAGGRGTRSRGEEGIGGEGIGGEGVGGKRVGCQGVCRR